MMMICVGHSISNNDFILILAVIAAGLVGSSRLILGAHEPNEIYGGYAIGFLAQFVALSYLAG
jgi:membrane-associated phospholipid phosphatase